MRQKLLLFFLISLGSYTIYAQSCTQQLNKAEDAYDAGKLLGIPASLEQCISDGSFSKEESIRAKKLLTLVYIFTDNESKSEKAIIELLKEDPEHELNPQVDPAELFFLYNQFQVEPIFRMAIRVGLNTSYVNVIEQHGLADLNRGYSKFYNGNAPELIDGAIDSNKFSSDQGLQTGFQIELMVEKHLGYGIEMGLGGQYRATSYTIEQSLNSLDINSVVTHNQAYLRTPLMVRYTFGYGDKKTYSKKKNIVKNKRIYPFVSVGGSADFLLSSQYSDPARTGGIAFTLPTDRADTKAAGLTESINYSVFAGLGVKFKIKTHFLTAELRYDNSLVNYINENKRYAGLPDVYNDLHMIEDDLTLNFLSFKVGYTHSIYKPKKLKEY